MTDELLLNAGMKPESEREREREYRWCSDARDTNKPAGGEEERERSARIRHLTDSTPSLHTDDSHEESLQLKFVIYTDAALS